MPNFTTIKVVVYQFYIRKKTTTFISSLLSRLFLVLKSVIRAKDRLRNHLIVNALTMVIAESKIN